MEMAWPELVWLIRHGRSLAQDLRDQAEKNGDIRFELGMEDAQIPLTELGRRQAEALGRWLGRLPPEQQPTVFLVSPFLRTLQTAEIAEQVSGIKGIRTIPDLRVRELRGGKLSCLTSKGIDQLYPYEKKKWQRQGPLRYHQPGGGMNRWQLYVRLVPVKHDLQAKYAGERVAVFTHSAVIPVLDQLLMKRSRREFVARLEHTFHDGTGQPANCSVTTYKFDLSSGQLQFSGYRGDPLAQAD